MGLIGKLKKRKDTQLKSQATTVNAVGDISVQNAMSDDIIEHADTGQKYKINTKGVWVKDNTVEYDKIESDLVVTGIIKGPETFIIDPAVVGDNTGTVVIKGNLQVDGTTTTINSTTIALDDKNIVLASGAASSAAADGAGITIDGASATFNYVNAGTKWQANKSIETNNQLISTVATGTAPLSVASTTAVTNLNADLLDGQHGSYYLDWTNTTNKPDPVITVTLTGDVTGTANTTLTDLASGTVSVATTIAPNSVALGTDTTGDYVAGITAGGGIAVTGTAGEGWSPTVAHADTSSQASVDNSGATVIQDVTLDTYGHVTGLASKTLGYSDVGAAPDSHTHSIDQITDEARIFNNMGNNHSTRTSFDAQGAALSSDFGWRYVLGSTNGPGVNGANQYYAQNIGLGNDYAYNNYAMQIAYPRNVTNPYISIRYEEGGALGAWQKISAGYADSAPWSGITGKPGTYPPDSHTHSFDSLTSKASGTGTYTTSGDFRAPIFYDSNDTGYYVDPNSTSRLYEARVNSISSQWVTTTQNADTIMPSHGGSFIHALVNGTGAPNDGHILAMTWTNTSAYGAQIWVDTDPSNTMAIRSRSGAGVWNSWANVITSWTNDQVKSGYFQSDSSLRAPIFYDSNDTGRYIDPNGDSHVNNVYSHGWFRNYGNQGLYNQDYGGHFYMQSGGVWSMTGNGGNFELQCRANHNSTIRGYLYGDTSNNFGLLNQNGSWKVRVNGSDVELYDYTYANDLRTYIMYDRNDTGYYVDPNSTSNLYKVIGYQGAKYQSTDWADAFRNTPTSGRCFHGDVSSGGPSGTWWFYDSMRHSNGNNYWGTQIAYGWEDNANEIYQRNITSNNFSGWVRYLNSNNYSGYAVKINDWHGNLYHHTDGRIYSTILYDSNDSGYYVDPNSTSVLNYTLTRRIKFIGEGGDSGVSNNSYAIYQEGGSWSHPYPDLAIGFHTGIKIGAYYGYNGTRFYNNSDFATIIGSFGDGDNNFRSYYNVIAYASDKRLKENITPISNALHKVLSLNGVTFDWKDLVNDLGFDPQHKHEVGVIAQDVESVLPEAVEIAPFDYDWEKENHSKSGERYLTVKYEKLTPLLIEAIKEQQKQLDEQRIMIEEMKSIIERIIK